MILTSVQLLYLSVSTSAYPSDAKFYGRAKRKIIKSYHVSNAPKKSTSKLSIYKHLFQCIQSILHSRWNHPAFVLAKRKNWNGWGTKTTQTSSDQHPQHQNTIPPKKATTTSTSTLQKKTYKKVGDRDLKIDALIFWDVKNSVPINHGAIDFWTRWHWSSQRWQWLFFCNFFGCKRLSIDLGSLKTGCCLANMPSSSNGTKENVSTK